MKFKTSQYYFRSGVRIFAPMVCMFLFTAVAFAQVDTTNTNKEDDDEKKIENIANNAEGELDYTDLFQDLEYYRTHPINLNTAKKEDLAKIYLLNGIQINNLLKHIKKNGKLQSIYELQTVEGFDANVINDIFPFVKVGGEGSARYTFREAMQNSSHDIFIRYTRVLEQQEGYSPISDSLLALKPNSRYLGSPDKLFVRYRYKFYNKISFGLTGEKDAGEQFFKGAQKNGFDFYSGHLMVNNISIIKSIVIGDYHVQFGQGLTLWSGMGFGKSGDVVNIKKMGQGLRPFTSTNESAFFRGGATTLAYKGFELTAFYSQKKVDANITGIDSVSSEIQYISSIQETGLHSTVSEVADRKAISERVIGGHFAYVNRWLNVGVTACHSKYGADLTHRPQVYNQFEFNGRENLNMGFDYSIIFRNFNFFGEVSRSENGGMAFLDGLMVSLDRHVSLSVLYRRYQKNYQALYSSAFSEGSKSANEEGIFTGLAIKFSPRWNLSVYCDYFDFPWLRYRTDAPSRGQDYLADLRYKPNKKLEMYLRYRYEKKEQNNTDEENVINYPEEYYKQSIRYHLSYQITKTLSIKDRIELSFYKKGNDKVENGYVIYQDVRYKPEKIPVSLSVRYALYQAKSYEARIYTYENDVLYGYSIPGFYGKGSRFYAMLKFDIGRHFDLWLRYAVTFYADKDIQGSGLTEIEGNKKSEIKAQLRMKF